MGNSMKILFATAISLIICNSGICSVNYTDITVNGTVAQTHPCLRDCSKSKSEMTCYYKFTLENYQTLSKACYDCPYNPEDCKRIHCIPGDGNKRPVAVVNRQMPGPTLEVCYGDSIIVDVENLLLGESTTIHWHGHHQRNTPYMDGTPFVTQCPIHPSNTFRYSFKADNPGTHFWHSHTGFQRADGAFGSFVVRTSKELDPHSKLYDFDLSTHVVIILDWGKEIGMHKFVAHHHSDGDNKPPTILVNGLGRFKEFGKNSGNESVFSPTARFVVKKGFRYRFRLINAEFLNCPIELSVDNHTLTVISSDGKDFEPVEVESLVSYAGERFDFVLKADRDPGLYWMRFKGLLDCDERYKSAHQGAVLQYEGVLDGDYPEDELDYEMAHKDGVQLNAVNKGTSEPNLINIAELKSLDPWDPSLKPSADFVFTISYDFYRLDNPHFHRRGLYPFKNVSAKEQLLTPQLNHITMKLLTSPLLPDRRNIDDGKFCNRTTVENCVNEFCECPHILQVPLDSVVELIIIDKGFAYDANHPFHLHGHSFRVIGMERIGKNVTEQTIKKLEEEGKIKRNLIDPPIKDTVTVPDGGYTILRFQATNPGYWLFHCHIEFHIEVGMALVFKVGANEEMPPVPPDFPKCGNYRPQTKKGEEENFNVIYSSAKLRSGGWFLFLIVVFILNVI